MDSTKDGRLAGYYSSGASFGKTARLRIRSEGRRVWSIDLSPVISSHGTAVDSHAIVHFFWSGFWPVAATAAGCPWRARRTRTR